MPYEQRTVKELEKNLSEVKETYKADDYYERFELNSYKVNVAITNYGPTYIEDASIQIIVDKPKGLIIACRIYEKPKEPYLRLVQATSPSFESLNYPSVETQDSQYLIKQDIGNVKHHIPMNAFKVPLRMVVHDDLVGQVINFNCKIFGKNLSHPIEKTLTLKIVSNEPEIKE